MKQKYTFRRSILVFFAISFAFYAVFGVPMPDFLENYFPGWVLWGIMFVCSLYYIAELGRPRVEKGFITQELVEFDIGMNR
jgi:hypothetical protein